MKLKSTKREFEITGEELCQKFGFNGKIKGTSFRSTELNGVFESYLTVYVEEKS